MRIGEFHAGLSGGSYVGTIFERLRRLGTVEELKGRLAALADGSDDTLFDEWGIWNTTSTPTSVPGPAGA